MSLHVEVSGEIEWRVGSDARVDQSREEARIDDEISELVKRASGQFVFASSLVGFVDDEAADPVELLDIILRRRVYSFKAIESLYLSLMKEAPAPQDDLGFLGDLILHIHYLPSSPSDIARFWFRQEDMVNTFVSSLETIFVLRHGLVDFRQNSFHDVVARSRKPGPYTLAAMNPVSKLFFFLRMKARNGDLTLMAFPNAQWLGYTFTFCDGRPVRLSSSFLLIPHVH